MIEYLVLTENSRGDIAHLVNKYIEQGWIPQGGISAVLEKTGFTRIVYYQAMIKATNNEEYKRLIK